nr:uncharacterized protein LOC126531368 [Dermacentor andersoni]
MKNKCRDMQKACDDTGEQANCTDTCPQDKATECKKFPYKECKAHNGEFICVCQSGLKESDDGQCKIGRKVTIRFKISNSRQKRETVDSSSKECNMDKTQLVAMLKKKEPNIDENTIVCKQDYSASSGQLLVEQEQMKLTDALEKVLTACPSRLKKATQFGSAQQ